MFGSERRLDTHKRLQNAIPYMTDSLYKVAATALWNKLYNNISDSQYVPMVLAYTSRTDWYSLLRGCGMNYLNLPDCRKMQKVPDNMNEEQLTERPDDTYTLFRNDVQQVLCIISL